MNLAVTGPVYHPFARQSWKTSGHNMPPGFPDQYTVTRQSRTTPDLINSTSRGTIPDQQRGQTEQTRFQKSDKWQIRVSTG
jgi:hypothetical protein